MALLNRAPAPDVTNQIRATLERSVASLPVQALQLRITQPGRTRMVLAHVVLPADFPVDTLSRLDTIQRSCQAVLRQDYPTTVLDMVFTADREMGQYSRL